MALSSLCHTLPLEVLFAGARKDNPGMCQHGNLDRDPTWMSVLRSVFLETSLAAGTFKNGANDGFPVGFRIPFKHV